MYSHQDPLPSRPGEQVAFSGRSAADGSLPEVHQSPDQPSSSHELASNYQVPVVPRHDSHNLAHSDITEHFDPLFDGPGGYGTWSSDNIATHELFEGGDRYVNTQAINASSNHGNAMSTGAMIDRCFSNSSSTAGSAANNPIGHGTLVNHPVDDELPLLGQSHGEFTLPDELIANINSVLARPTVDTTQVSGLASQQEVANDVQGDHISTSTIKLDISPKHENYFESGGLAAPKADGDIALFLQSDDGLSERPELYRNKVSEALECTSETRTEFASLEEAKEKLKCKYERPREDSTIPTTEAQKRAIVKALVDLWIDTDSSKDNPRYRENFRHKHKDLNEIELNCWRLLDCTIKHAQEGPLFFKQFFKKHTGNIGSFACRMAAVMELVHRHKTKCDILARPSIIHQLVHDPLGQQKASICNQFVNKRKAISLQLGNQEAKRRRIDLDVGSHTASPAQNDHTPRSQRANRRQQAQPQRTWCSLRIPPRDQPQRQTHGGKPLNGIANQEGQKQQQRGQHSPGGQAGPLPRRPQLTDRLYEEKRRKAKEASDRAYAASVQLQQANQVDRSAQPSTAGLRRYSDPISGMPNPLPTLNSDAYALPSPPGFLASYGTPAAETPSATAASPQTPHDPDSLSAIQWIGHDDDLEQYEHQGYQVNDSAPQMQVPYMMGAPQGLYNVANAPHGLGHSPFKGDGY
ncbi:hypothetical protein BDV06DRAFT_220905 [Aspergillus oleicola]